MGSTKSVSRAQRQHAVAAAYRAGDKLFDENKAHKKTHDYQKRSGVLSEPTRDYWRLNILQLVI